MRRIAVVPLLFAIGLLAGCSQVAQFAGDATGVDVEQLCGSVDSVYDQYQGMLDQGDASAEQVTAARDGLVGTLDGVADDVGGPAGDLIRSSAQQLADVPGPDLPEAIEAIEQLKNSLEPFCG